MVELIEDLGETYKKVVWKFIVKVNDKLKFDKSKYMEFIKSGGKSSEFGKEFVVVKGSKTIKEKFCLNNSNFILNLPFITLAYGVTGNTPGFGPGESRFEP